MNAIDRPGTFRGKPQEWGVSESKGGYPQFVVRIKADEYYDEEAGQWMPWSEYDQETTGYLILYTKDKTGQWQELLNSKQIKKALGWNGLDFESLANGKFEETTVLFRIEPNEFNGVTTLKMPWLDSADANPVKTLAKFDTSKLKELTAKMGGALSASAPVAPAKAPAKATAVPPKRSPGRPKSTPVASPAKSEEKPAAPSTATPPPASPAPATPAPSGNLSETKDSAWTACNELKAKDITDAKLAEIWLAEAGKINKPEDAFTHADWATVKEAVLNQVSVI
jgi:hypothetical protein